MPYETNNPPAIDVVVSNNSNAIDIMKVYDDGAGGTIQSPTPQTGTLTSSTITGLDLPGVAINYANLQTVQVLLGIGDDNFTVASTDNSTMTIIEGGGGSNTITVAQSTGPLVIYGNESASGAEYSSAPGAINGTGYSFTNFGTNIIDATNATGVTVIVGGPKHDDLTGGSGINWIAGGEGDDTIIASGTANYIFGDSSFTIDPLTRLMTIDNGLLPMDAGINGGVLSAGVDTITVTGSGSSTVFGDFGTVNIVGQPAGVVDPFSSLGSEVITKMASANTALGGDDQITVGNNDVIIGGAGADSIIVGATGADVLIGDDGEIDYTYNSSTHVDVLTSIKTTDSVHGGADTIAGPKDVHGNYTPGGGSNSIIIGGIGGDTIDVGGANNTIIGDDGQATYDPTTGKLIAITTEDPAVGGVDIINVTGGNNAIIGGFGADQITIGGGGNIVLGDNGFADFTAAGVLTFITTSDQTEGGDDVIEVDGSGNNQILGGSGADRITVNGTGKNVIFGDNGDASFDGTTGNLTKIETIGETSPAAGVVPSAESSSSGTIYGGDDTIKIGDGDNVVVGGFGADGITTGTGNDIILGDSGIAHFDATTGGLVSILSTFGSIAAPSGTNPDNGTSSDDVITLGGGNNVVIGGAGSDQIVVGTTGANVVIGDDGEADYTNGILTKIFSTDVTIGGIDTIAGPTVSNVVQPGGSGNNIVIGGVAGDTITLGGSNNTIIGDNGQANFDATGVRTSITTTSPTSGGNDIITVTGGSNVIFGGVGGDTIKVQTVNVAPSGNIIVGDDGSATFTAGVLTHIETADSTFGGDDQITTGDGDNVILGGSGADQITVGDGNNIVLGDNGTADLTAAGVLVTIQSTDPAYGGDDVIQLGAGNNVVIGGSGGDKITAGKLVVGVLTGGDGRNIVIGDNGEADFTGGVLTTIQSTATSFGGDDAITLGKGDNVVIGGLGADHITTGDGNDVIVGDSGFASFDATGVLTQIYSTSPDVTGGGTPSTGSSSDDIILIGNGDNIVIGGSGGDQITAGVGNDVIVGDNGEADFSAGIVTSVKTTSPTFGGEDVIKTGNGRDIVLGGWGADNITTGTGNNVILGDNGIATFTAGILTVIQSTDTSIGGDDTIKTGGGNNVVIGGLGADTITTFGGNDVILGDSGYAQFSSTGNLLIIYTTSPDATFGGAKDTGTSSNDIINAGDGDNVVLGGVGGDQITTGSGR